jgi:hypothetical protein
MNNSLSPVQQHREAVLLSFCDPVPPACAALEYLSGKEWQQLLHWMDISGLALYFLDHMTQLRQVELLPPHVLARLRQNLADSTERTAAMIAESTAIHRSFQAAGLSYATLKGFSLWPVSVPKLELRSQLDLDFLMAEKDAPQARQILEARGYHLGAISGRSWEFKSNGRCRYSIKDLYKPLQQHAAELHLESSAIGSDSLLARTQKSCFHGVCSPVLAPVDLFLGQGLHLYKHICGESSRAAHLIEFRRHIIARYGDNAFWQQLRDLAERNPLAPAALGLVTLLISHLMGEFAPEAFTSWTVDRLPATARLWVELYGHRIVLGSLNGTKLYLLLQREMEGAGIPAGRSLRQALLPYRLPPVVTHAAPGETLPMRIQRHRAQLHFIWFRLRFHFVEGLRYLRESARWRRRIEGLTR